MCSFEDSIASPLAPLSCGARQATSITRNASPRTSESAGLSVEQVAVDFRFDLVLSVFEPAEGRGDQDRDLGVLLVTGDLVWQVRSHGFSSGESIGRKSSWNRGS